jgi:hypothetical protein
VNDTSSRSAAEMDPRDTETLDQFTQALQQLRGNRSYAALGKAAARLTVRDGRRPALPSSIS